MLETKKTLEAQEIQAILPHRYPMLMVDRVLDLNPGESVVAQKNVSINEQIFQGHFPGNPIFPGVLQIEAMAQAGAIALLSMPDFKGKTAYLGGIKKAKFRHMVRPGDVLRIEVTLEKLIDNAGLGKGKIYVGENMASSADLVFAIG
ncbi:3-hydroxyacyl-ACP dehydratase FabZ [Lacticaseibacillus paracasei]|uniref:3-hydroxyacyl-ACP dehydratase FabZ n=1 Tax=Lacticaseibacillus paracasei TaxID=1597 RepID=UPI000297CE8E|nr:3-hydroxyacyl-ACP dehydratase FabZ [Lacticaseibacillus paracasei]EKP97450.1 (3R)-hydroxymyristoyl-[acyl carrier protein] dehydratase [Lacticaseibacillus casei 12A]MBS0992077.1 3-hydroxyacyl-ACP dehydratase FabZ [Lacticaseibacillus paracasei]MCT4385818.1 3-hydroxyacyl-ACP dehydratase FabZ [Lacticaseibacillus paracasei]RNE02098.1 3-hydroxyacyl-[acyl-carrier-protein] dehydratase FabZ [Lacticaseibacillus paracasei]UWY23849.1 3-hydroxyacyl-ACP dehydratase FabZ [Lacticaseibacillus paracasei]